MILSDIPADKAGVASGTNSTVRQVGAALGVAVVGSVFASLTVQRTIEAVRASRLPAALRDTAVAGVHAQGAGFPVPSGTPAADAATLSHALASGITDAIQPALLLAAAFVAVGAVLSLLLPKTPPVPAHDLPLVEVFDRWSRSTAPASTSASPPDRSGAAEHALHRISIATARDRHAAPGSARVASDRLGDRVGVTRDPRGPSSDSHRPPSTCPTAARPLRSTLRTFCERSPVITRTTPRRVPGEADRAHVQRAVGPQVLSVPR